MNAIHVGKKSKEMDLTTGQGHMCVCCDHKKAEKPAADDGEARVPLFLKIAEKARRRIAKVHLK